MSDVQQHMTRILTEHRKKNPELAYRFVDSKPDELRIRTETDGWKLVKQEGAGTAGEVRVGDLLLAAKPRKEIEEEQARDRKRSARALDSGVSQFNSDIKRAGGQGRYLQPLTPEEAANFDRKG